MAKLSKIALKDYRYEFWNEFVLIAHDTQLNLILLFISGDQSKCDDNGNNIKGKALFLLVDKSDCERLDVNYYY